MWRISAASPFAPLSRNAPPISHDYRALGREPVHRHTSSSGGNNAFIQQLAAIRAAEAEEARERRNAQIEARLATLRQELRMREQEQAGDAYRPQINTVRGKGLSRFPMPGLI
ncbi:hypothetical protein Rhopal_000328-T1 [Rhodotorula paludigena]|uniref:Uncharacterized protein n=1 Tax=Rhodotorula paludigena TaxID=86838 RepID=A0AAV5GDE2_9BASI|nr:hypothetical protein Rhopal_000328-T1 [Rhodotorula paludigena]